MASKKKEKAPRKSNAEAKLTRLMDSSTAPAPTGPLVTNPKIFFPFLEIVRSYLVFHQYSDQARQLVAEMALHFRKEALSRYKHETIETFELSKALHFPALRQAERQGRPDSVSFIQQNADATRRLTIEEQAAAEHIQQVWRAFQRGMGIGSREPGKVGGSGQNLHPLDTMSEDLWKSYQKYYQPWYRHANKIVVCHTNSHQQITVASIVFRVLVEDIYPATLDSAFSLPTGTCLGVLRAGLANYHSPARLAGVLRPKKEPGAPKSCPPAASSPSPAIPEPASKPEAPQNAPKSATKKAQKKSPPSSRERGAKKPAKKKAAKCNTAANKAP